MILVIGIGSKARQGKTSLGIILQAILQSRGAYVQTFNFADPLKSKYRIESNKYEGKNATELQKLADSTKELYGEGIYARDLVARIHDHYKSVETVSESEPQVVYLVPDLRHKVELEALKTFPELVLVRVTREGEVEADRDTNHKSETELDFPEWEDYEIKASNMHELKIAALQLTEAIFGETQSTLQS